MRGRTCLPCILHPACPCHGVKLYSGCTCQRYGTRFPLQHAMIGEQETLEDAAAGTRLHGDRSASAALSATGAVLMGEETPTMPAPPRPPPPVEARLSPPRRHLHLPT